MTEKLKIIYRPLKDLTPYARNARTHDEDQVMQLVASIEEFGWTNPVLIDEKGEIIAGHGRVLAAVELSVASVPTITLSGLTDAQKRAYRLADNQLALNGGWNSELLKVEIESLLQDGFDINLVGFDSGFVDDLLAEQASGKTDPDDVPDPQNSVVSAVGDLWLLGRHRLLCGDATVPEQVEKLCAGQLVDMWLTDPPYNVGYVGKTRKAMTIQNDAQESSLFRKFLVKAYTAADVVMKPGAVFYIWHAESEGMNFRGAAGDVMWQIRQCLIWNKNTHVLSRSDYHWKHEPCLYGWKSGAAHLWAGDRKQSTVLECDRPQKNAEHPTIKPVELFEGQILNNTRGGDIILDSFAGSGTTVIACEVTGRNGRLLEVDPRYVDVIIRRWQVFTGLHAVHQETGKTFDELSCCVEAVEVVSPQENDKG
ncbi:site-specific DNA-methyltransferase [Rahnella sp. ChDrAdgB13]|uniref:site-specific DNA-methyltransferase n=1 Tax=Rahnella sp. ChDrAdgB13 TaxID=1850581 RepID=UPI001AD86285|nr:site-specific DNA-methyltransferase [Rahnella sp. ChDrAdgB13]